MTQRLLRFGLPAIFGCFVIVYFVVGAYYYYS